MSGKEQRVKPRRLKGFQDYTPQIMAQRFKVIDTVRRIAKLSGFEPIATPALEYSEVLLGVGGETDKQVFRFLDNGERDVSLRFDLTVPFARFVAEHSSELVLPFKRMQIGDVWRAEKPQKGRYREFGQCDLDIIGAESIGADVEVISSFAQIISELKIGPFTIWINHRGVLSALIRQLLRASSTEESAVLIAVDKLDKIGTQAVKELLAEIPSVDKNRIDQFLDLLTAKDQQGHSDLAAIEVCLADDQAGKESVQALRDFMKLIGVCTPADGVCIRVNLAVARGLGYYTGIVFETTLDHLTGFGSICSGGRYDRLVERFSSQQLSGVGGSLGLDRLVAAIQETGQNIANEATQSVFIAVAGDESLGYGFKIANELRSVGIRTDVGLKTRKLSAQFKYADRKNYPLVITVGSDEEKTRTFALKIMSSGQEEKNLNIMHLTKIILEKL